MEIEDSLEAIDISITVEKLFYDKTIGEAIVILKGIENSLLLKIAKVYGNLYGIITTNKEVISLCVGDAELSFIPIDRIKVLLVSSPSIVESISGNEFYCFELLDKDEYDLVFISYDYN